MVMVLKFTSSCRPHHDVNPSCQPHHANQPSSSNWAVLLRHGPGTTWHCKCICNMTKYSSHHHASSQMIPSITDCNNIYHMALHVMTSYWHRHNIHANLFFPASLPLPLPCNPMLSVCVFIFIFIFHYISFYTWRVWSWLNATASAKSVSVKICLRKNKKKLVY